MRNSKWNRRLGLAAVVAVAAAGAQGTAWADVHSKARVSNFGFRLVDLRPNDGIAPGIEFLTGADLHGQTWAAARYSLWETHGGTPGLPLEAEDVRGDEQALFTPLAVAVSQERLSSAARIAGSVFDHSLSFVARGTLLNDGSDARRFAGSNYSAAASPAAVLGPDANRFRLAPYTRVVWSGDLFMQVRSTVGFAQRVKEDAASRLLLSMGPVDGGPGASLVHDLDIYAFKPREKRYETPFALALSNDGPNAMTAALQFTVAAGGSLRNMAPSAPVPEPGAWALMLCGLGMVGAAARARRGRGEAEAAAAA